MAFEPTAHPVLRIPTPDEMLVMGPDKWFAAMKRREKIIAQEANDPLRHGWEPWAWKLCDALLALPWVDEEWADGVRAALGFERPVNQLLISGGNRGGKSEYAAKRCSMIENLIKGARVWAFCENNANSVEQLQPLGWKYLPKELRRTIKSQVGYVSYNQKYGFSDNKYVLPNASEKSYRNYEQRIETLEGGECNFIWCDELVSPEWIDTLGLRISTRDGWLVSTFTPVKGYTSTVKLFLDGATTVLENVGHMLPKDGKEPLVEAALMRQDLSRLSEGVNDRSAMPDGRKFEMVPRVMKCFDEDRAVVFFETSDNPYGNPPAVWEKIKAKPAAYIRERWYGIASKMMSSRFPRFDRKIHVLKAKDIPENGTNYLIGDPSSGRNYFWIWVRVIGRRIYIYREWPGRDEIPGVGVPGPWALPDGRHPDGKKGPAQDPFGFGLTTYKREIARLEGWSDAEKKGTERIPIAEWDPANGTRERVEMRWLDSRAASAPRLENDRPVTLQEEFERIGLHFELTPGDDIAEGVALVNDLLDYDDDEEISATNCPRMYVAEECRNTIFSLENWTGQDGRKGACKDPIDLCRYVALLRLEELEEGSWESEGGGIIEG